MLFLILFVLAAGQAASFIYQDPASDQAIREALDATYKLDLPAARRIAAGLQTRLPDHPAGFMLDAETYWWEAQTDPENKKIEETYFQKQERAVDVAEKALKSAKYPKIEINAYLASAYGSKARFLLTQRGVGWGTVSAGRKAHGYAEEVYEADPNYIDILVGIGAYNYFAGKVPAVLKPFAWLLGASGDSTLGLEQLRTAIQKGRYTKTEARIVYFTALMKDAQYPEALRILEGLMSDYPNNVALYPWATQWHREQSKNLEGADYFERLYIRRLSSSPRVAAYALFEKAQLQNAHARPAEARQTLARIRAVPGLDPTLASRVQSFEKTLRK